jgi:hypothetical protein
MVKVTNLRRTAQVHTIMQWAMTQGKIRPASTAQKRSAQLHQEMLVGDPKEKMKLTEGTPKSE